MLKKEGDKGITLIALIITIIVLLILAGITIAMISGNNSAPQKATEAAQKDAIAGAKQAMYYSNTSQWLASPVSNDIDYYVCGVNSDSGLYISGWYNSNAACPLVSLKSAVSLTKIN